jgi:hypothetical protein
MKLNMQEDTKTPETPITTTTTSVATPTETPKVGNRKERRFKAKLARSRKERKTYGVSHWVQRFIREMKDNPEVIKKVASGELDKYLK